MSTLRITRTTRPVSAPRSRFWRSSNGRLWLLQAVLAIGYLGAAAPKLGNDPQIVAAFADLGVSAAGMHAIGVLEVAGAVALVVPRLVGVAATAFVALMVGAVTLTAVHGGVVDAIAPAVFLGLVAALAWCRRDRTLRLANDLVRAATGHVTTS